MVISTSSPGNDLVTLNPTSTDARHCSEDCNQKRGATRLLQEPLYSTKGACAKFSNRMIGASWSERLTSRQRLSFTSPSRTA